MTQFYIYVARCIQKTNTISLYHGLKLSCCIFIVSLVGIFSLRTFGLALPYSTILVRCTHKSITIFNKSLSWRLQKRVIHASSHYFQDGEMHLSRNSPNPTDNVWKLYYPIMRSWFSPTRRKLSIHADCTRKNKWCLCRERYRRALRLYAAIATWMKEIRLGLIKREEKPPSWLRYRIISLSSSWRFTLTINYLRPGNRRRILYNIFAEYSYFWGKIK